MNSKMPLADMKEKARRDYIFNFFRERKLIAYRDNVIYSEKLFKLNAVLRWCLDKIENKQMNTQEWKKYNKMISQYVAGMIELEWGDNSLKTIELKQNGTRRNRRKP